MSEEQKRTGGCLCGAVRYEIIGPSGPVVVCHCSQCRKTHGDSAGYTRVTKARLNLMEARGLAWFQSSESARRGFCKECGGSLFYDPIETDRISVAAGTIDGKTGLKTAGHIFVADKPDYCELPEGMRHFPGLWTE